MTLISVAAQSERAWEIRLRAEEAGIDKSLAHRARTLGA
jgi:hypothetical protein